MKLKSSTDLIIRNIHRMFNRSRERGELLVCFPLYALSGVMIILTAAYLAALTSISLAITSAIGLAITFFASGVVALSCYCYVLDKFSPLKIEERLINVVACADLGIRKIVMRNREIKNITVKELISLARTYFKFYVQVPRRRSLGRQAIEIGLNSHRTKSYFIDFLKRSHRVDQLAILVKLEADRGDCHLATFEEVDAKAVHPEGKLSLQWLAALAVNQHRHKISISTTSNQVKAIIDASKNYVPLARKI
ncbi:MAG: hypothetical protein JSS07_04740 [Proteobacteria bacterium]|nr:hypothetical protein [Pseudomonadota bacterium]